MLQVNRVPSRQLVCATTTWAVKSARSYATVPLIKEYFLFSVQNALRATCTYNCNMAIWFCSRYWLVFERLALQILAQNWIYIWKHPFFKNGSGALLNCYCAIIEEALADNHRILVKFVGDLRCSRPSLFVPARWFYLSAESANYLANHWDRKTYSLRDTNCRCAPDTLLGRSFALSRLCPEICIVDKHYIISPVVRSSKNFYFTLHHAFLCSRDCLCISYIISRLCLSSVPTLALVIRIATVPNLLYKKVIGKFSFYFPTPGKCALLRTLGFNSLLHRRAASLDSRFEFGRIICSFDFYLRGVIEKLQFHFIPPVVFVQLRLLGLYLIDLSRASAAW